MLGLTRGYGRTLAALAKSFLSSLNDLNDAVGQTRKKQVFSLSAKLFFLVYPNEHMLKYVLGAFT